MHKTILFSQNQGNGFFGEGFEFWLSFVDDIIKDTQ